MEGVDMGDGSIRSYTLGDLGFSDFAGSGIVT